MDSEITSHLDNDSGEGKVKKPKHILKLYDASFILPDEFSGNINDAIFLLYNHIEDNYFPSANKLLGKREINNGKLCMDYGILKYNEKTDEYDVMN